MKHLLIACYRWDELSIEQKKKICEMNRDIDLDILTTEDIVWDHSNAGQLIADQGFLNPDVHFSYSNSQGDGACFDCDMFNWDLLLEDLDIPHKSLFKKLLNDSYQIITKIHTPNVSYAYHYLHEGCREFIVDAEAACPEKVWHILLKIEEHVEAKRCSICKEAFNEIRKAIDFIRSDERLMLELASIDCYWRGDTLQSINENELWEIKGGKSDVA